MKDFIDYVEEEIAAKLEARKKEDDKIKEEAKKENFFTKKFTGNQMLFGILILGPAFGLLIRLIALRMLGI